MAGVTDFRVQARVPISDNLDEVEAMVAIAREYVGDKPYRLWFDINLRSQLVAIRIRATG